MRMLILGDFTGRSSPEASPGDPRLSERPIVHIDVDDFEQVLWRFAPRARISLPGPGSPAELEFRAFDDFRPESLYERVSVFTRFRALRRRLLDDATFESAAAELRALLGNGPGPVTAEAEAPVADRSEVRDSESDAEVLERLLGAPATGVAVDRSRGAERVRTAVSELIQHAVAPHVVSERSPRREVYLRALDDLVGERMRRLLHAPAFQALEAGWRSLHHLVTHLETGEALQVHVLDVSRQELAADLAAAGGDLKASGLYRLLVEGAGRGTPGGEPWSLLIGNFRFGPEPEDLGLLAALGVIAASAGGPFLAAAGLGLLGCRVLAETPDPSAWGALPPATEAAWNALRQSPIAPWVGLALPRVLLRLPYGRETEPTEGLAFEELGHERRHEDYLWGNPSFACALLIAHAYAARGWSMAPGDTLDLGDLPAHVYREEGETRLQACAEVYLSERAATAILERGIMPLLSFKGRNLVRLARFQSIASPSTALMGSWRE
jgi:type VI secretion system protein ImpC